MSASTNPLVVQGTVSFPPDEGQQAVPVSFGYSGSYTQILDSRMALTGAGTTSVPFGGIGSPGVKFALLEYEADPVAAAVTVKFNGSADGIELQPGGLFLYANPAPGTSITAISLIRTADAVIRVRLFG
jgi:hypothetical protein